MSKVFQNLSGKYYSVLEENEPLTRPNASFNPENVSSPATLNDSETTQS